MADVYKTEEFLNEWANDIQFHIARNLLHLRRHRKMSQSAVGSAMGTSQSAIARIESAQENITLDTLYRLIVALKGRLSIEICPQEYPSKQQKPAWWELPTAAPLTAGWTVVASAVRVTGEVQQALVGLERYIPLTGVTPTALQIPEGKTN